MPNEVGGMAIGETRHATGAPRLHDDGERRYEGKPGRTRLRSIHVPLPSGFVRLVQVYEAVNVATDPQLRDALFAGALHRFESGEELAIPFVYHDPIARKFALVVPETLRHDELRARSRLLADIAEDTDAPVPAYVREATAVIGIAGLRAYLDRPSAHELGQREAAIGAREVHADQRDSAYAQREASLAQRELALETRLRDIEIQVDAFAQREARLKTRAEQITRREDELRTLAEELEAQNADLAVREQELQTRLEQVRDRETELAQRGSAPPAREEDVEQLLDESRTSAVPEDDVEELDDLEPIPTNPGVRMPERALADAEQVDAEQVEEDRPSTPSGALADEVEELIEDVFDEEPAEALGGDEVEELDEVEPIGDVTGVHEEPLRGQKTTVIEAPRLDAPLPPPGSRADMTALVEDGAVRLFVRLPQGREDAFDPRAQLLAQLAVIDDAPVLLLSLVEGLDGPHVARAALDPRAVENRPLLEALRRRYAASVDLYDHAGEHLRTIEVSAPRELNVARITERIAKLPTSAARIEPAAAIERALAAPPPVRAKDHPYDDQPIESAAEAAEVIDRLLEWSAPDKQDHALLVLSIPREQMDQAIRRALERAIEFGLALPDPLEERALALGLAPDLVTLVGRQIDAFAQTTRASDHGLSNERVADSWKRLLRIAAEHDVVIDGATHELAWRAMHGGRGVDVDTAQFGSLGTADLTMLLEHPRHRRRAAIELAGRRDSSFADALCRAVRKMPRAEVVAVAPKLVALGDEAGDAMIDALSARKAFTRHAFALALGELELRRAVVPLVHLLGTEETELWREIARVVGEFGNASLRNVTRQLREPKGLEERYVLTLAHLANHGCGPAIEKLVQEEKGEPQRMAREALASRDRAKTEAAVARGQSPLRSPDPQLQFARRFYEELAGKAPAQDLDEPTSA